VGDVGDAVIVARALQGDLDLDCKVNVVDEQMISFRYKASLGSIWYRPFFDLEPQPGDGEIDTKDLQFVYGRDGSTCEDPKPPQPPGSVAPCADNDSDDICDGFDPDDDNDGCDDSDELVGAPEPRPGATGAYNPLLWYDFYDVPVPAIPDMTPNGPKNRAVGMADVLAVLFYGGAANDDVPNANGGDYDSDKDGDTVEDGRGYDRSPSAAPNPPWEAGPPDGSVSTTDVLAVLAQVGLACGAAP
jgi:hypothetical protein